MTAVRVRMCSRVCTGVVGEGWVGLGARAPGAGEILGEMSLLLDMPRTATVRALTALRVFAMDRAAFEKLVEGGDPAVLKFGLALSRVLAHRVVRLNERVVDLLVASEGAEPLHHEFSKARQELFNLWE